MFNSNDIYSHLLNGGDKQVLFNALSQEIAKAEEKVKITKEAEQNAQKAKEKELKARTAAFKAIKAYVALVNPTLDDAFIDSALDICKNFKIIAAKDAQTPDWLLDLFKLI